MANNGPSAGEKAAAYNFTNPIAQANNHLIVTRGHPGHVVNFGDIVSVTVGEKTRESCDVPRFTGYNVLDALIAVGNNAGERPTILVPIFRVNQEVDGEAVNDFDRLVDAAVEGKEALREATAKIRRIVGDCFELTTEPWQATFTSTSTTVIDISGAVDLAGVIPRVGVKGAFRYDQRR
jgi:hypothetical protein